MLKILKEYWESLKRSYQDYNITYLENLVVKDGLNMITALLVGIILLSLGQRNQHLPTFRRTDIIKSEILPS